MRKSAAFFVLKQNSCSIQGRAVELTESQYSASMKRNIVLLLSEPATLFALHDTIK